MEIRIVPFEEKYAGDFIALSREWLEKYVSVEPADIEILYHPQRSVLDGGGEIFFALAGEKPVGVVAMIQTEPSCFELAKLAVTESFQGKGVGRKLMARALTYARERRGEKVTLYTNGKLKAAIGLYRAFGFEEIPLGNNKYLESDMKMELILKEGEER